MNKNFIGYVENLDEEIYHNFKISNTISKSSLDLLDRSDLHFVRRLEKDKTRPMALGSAFHSITLEPETMSKYKFTDFKNRLGKDYKNLVSEYGDGMVFTKQESEFIVNMKNACYENEAARKLLELDGNNEFSGFCEIDGVRCRHRFDKLTKCGIGIDLKKTQDIRKVERTIFDYRYHVQAAFYSDQYQTITGEKLKSFKFIFVEEKYPHAVRVVELDDISLDIGRQEYKKNLEQFKVLRNNNFKVDNNIPEEIVSLPNWVMDKYMADMLESSVNEDNNVDTLNHDEEVGF